MADKAALTDRLPTHILQTQTALRRCPGCGRIFWPGTHVERMKQLLDDP